MALYPTLAVVNKALDGEVHASRRIRKGPKFLGQNTMVSNFLKVVPHVRVLSLWGWKQRLRDKSALQWSVQELLCLKLPPAIKEGGAKDHLEDFT